MIELLYFSTKVVLVLYISVVCLLEYSVYLVVSAGNTCIQISDLDSGESRNFEKGESLATVIYRECT